MSNSKLRLLVGIAILLNVFVGCQPTVKLQAPDKPVTINLNVDVQHKLKVQMDKHVDDAIKSNKHAF